MPTPTPTTTTPPVAPPSPAPAPQDFSKYGSPGTGYYFPNTNEGTAAKAAYEANQQANSAAALAARTGVSTAGAGIVSSSAPVVAQENNTKNTVAGLMAPDPSSTAVQAASDSYIKLLKDQQQMLEQRRQQDLTGIGAQFDEAKRQAGDQQKKEVATTSTALQRIGGYLGNSASSVGALNNLAQTHQQEMTALEGKRAAAIQAANNAINDKQFELAAKMAQEAKQVAVDIADRRDKFFSQSLQLVQEQRQQDKFLQEKYTEQLKNLSVIDPAKVNPADLKDIDDFYGIPGFAHSYLEVTKKANDAKNEKDVIEARKATLDLLQNIPQGQKLTFPDGTEYTGMGKAGDISTFMQVDAAGIGRIITYNKLTGKKDVANVGVVGKPSSSGGGSGFTTIGKTDPVVIDNATMIFQKELEANPTKDGNYDPDIYVEKRNALKESKFPQLVPHMDKLFLNPNNQFFSDSAIKKLRKEYGIFYSDVIIPDEPVVEGGYDALRPIDNTSITKGEEE